MLYVVFEPTFPMGVAFYAGQSDAQDKTHQELVEAAGSVGGGGSQVPVASLDEVDADGMTQLRGESHQDQDKFRITVDLEQRYDGYFDPDQVPHSQ